MQSPFVQQTNSIPASGKNGSTGGGFWDYVNEDAGLVELFFSSPKNIRLDIKPVFLVTRISS